MNIKDIHIGSLNELGRRLRRPLQSRFCRGYGCPDLDFSRIPIDEYKYNVIFLCDLSF